MRLLLPLLLLLVAGLALPLVSQPAAPALAAPSGFAGTYDLTKTDGTPIFTGIEVTVTVVPAVFPCYFGIVAIDEGNGPVAVDIMTICPNGDGYDTKNSAGNTGTITPKGSGQYQTEMTSGPNSGTKRKMSKQP